MRFNRNNTHMRKACFLNKAKKKAEHNYAKN